MELKLGYLLDQLTKARKLSDAQKKCAAAEEAQLQHEKDKNKALKQRLSDQFALKKNVHGCTGYDRHAGSPG